MNLQTGGFLKGSMFKIQKLDLLISIYIFCIAVSELMGGKTFSIINAGALHLNASVAIFVVPAIYCINDLVIEVYGKSRAQSIVRSGLLVVLMVFLFSILAVFLPPSQRFLSSEKSYEAVFSVSARISAASLIAFSIAEFADVMIFSRIRKKLGTKALWLRTNIANVISQLLDTSIFMVLAFYAFDKTLGSNLAFLWSLILPYWLLKCFMSIIETPFVYLGVNWLKSEKNSK